MTADGGRGPTFRSALRSRAFRLLLAGHGVGTIAQLMLTLAVGIEVLDRTSSGIWVSVTVALGFAPYVVFSGYAGLLADRWSRSAVLTWSLRTRAGCGVVLAAGLLLHWPVPVLVLIAAVAAVLATPSYPALAAGTAQCVPDEPLPAANALVTGVENATWIAGPGVLGLLLLAGQGPAVATWLAAALFVLAAGLTARVSLPRPVRGEPIDGSVHELTAGITLVGTDARVRRPMTVAVIDNFLYGYLVVAIVLLVDAAGGGSAIVGWLNAGLSGGALGAMLVVNRLAAHDRPAVVLGVVMVGFGTATALLGLVGGIALSVALVTLAGAATLIAEVIAVTLLQRAAPDDLVARVFGVYDQLNVGAIALGSMLAGPLADRLGPRTATVVVGCCGLVAAVLATYRMRERHAGRHSRAATRGSGVSPGALPSAG